MLSVYELGLQRGGRWLFRDLSLKAGTGTVNVVMGPNGTGKSSLLLALAGLLDPDTGTVQVSGCDLAHCSRLEAARLVAWQGEFPPAEFGLTVKTRLALALPALLEKGQERLEAVSRDMELEGLLDASLGRLSSGECQRVELAALMLRDSPVWLLDEPAAHLDFRHQAAALAMLRRQAQQGRTVVVVLHDIQQALAVADHVILLADDGRVRTGPADDMLQTDVLEAVFGLPLDDFTGVDGACYIVPRYRR
ncbi:MAG TPA: ABC transporter ATP-binding protein [Mariprofundaceae bacterium]|nr:ABC transporter ATP-binding protein [Mariprofundaceae bacterium]